MFNSAYYYIDFDINSCDLSSYDSQTARIIKSLGISAVRTVKCEQLSDSLAVTYLYKTNINLYYSCNFTFRYVTFTYPGCPEPDGYEGVLISCDTSSVRDQLYLGDPIMPHNIESFVSILGADDSLFVSSDYYVFNAETGVYEISSDYGEVKIEA